MICRTLAVLLGLAACCSLGVLSPAAAEHDPGPPAASDEAAPERLPPPLPDAADSPLTLDSVRELALRYNPSLAAVAARIRAARWNALQQGLPPNPNISYQGNEMGNEGNAGQQGAGVSQRFITGKKLQLAREVARRQVLVEQQRFAAQRQRVLTDVSMAFYQTLILQRRTQLVEGLVTTSLRAVEASERLFAAAESRKTDLLQARVELQKARLDLIQARARHAAAWRDLAAVIGIPDLPRQALVGKTDPGENFLSWQEATQTVLSGHPELARAMARVNQATWSVQSAEAQWIPDVTASVAVQHDNETGDEFASVQVTLPLPLWNRNQGGVGNARAQLTAARRGVEVVELRLRQDLAEEYQRYESAYEWARQYEKQILPLAQETLELVSRGYAQGEVAYLDQLTAQRTYVQANLDYLDALAQLWSSIQRIEGLLLDNSLATP